MKILKYSGFLMSVSVILMFLLCADTNAQSFTNPLVPTEKRIVLPTAQDALKAVFSKGNILLSSIPSCKRQGTTLEDRTILDYLSGIIGFQAEPKTHSSLKYTVKLIRKNGRPIWEVELMFYTGTQSSDEADDVIISNGFRFLMRTQDKKMITDSLTCIGTG